MTVLHRLSSGGASRLLLLVAAITACAVNAQPLTAPANELLQPEKAFRIAARALDESTVEVEFTIAGGYYMYRDRFSFATESGAQLGEVEMPLADEAAIRRMMQEKLHAGGEVESVQKAPFGDLYEVVIRAPGGALVYDVDRRATVIIAGPVIDAKTGRNLTEERQRELSAL